MLNKISLRPAPLLSLGLAALLSLSAGCKKAPEKSVTATDTATSAAPATPAAPTAAAPAAPGTVPGAAVPGQAGAPAAALAPEKLPAVVAKVNGQAIKKDDLLKGGQMVQMRYAQMGHPIAPSADFYRQVLNELITITLLQQEAKAQGVTASDQEVQQAIASRKSAFPNEDAYKKALQQAGLTEEMLRQQARDQLAVQRYVQTRILPGVNVSDQAAREFYDKNKEKMQVPERLHLRHILIQVDPTAPADAQAKGKQKAEEVLKKLQAGEDFAKLAGEYSDDPGSKTRGGDIGLLTRGRTPPQFEAAAFALKKPNDLSPVVQSRFGYHILQLLERQPPTAVPFEQVKERIIMSLKEQEVQKLVTARASQLRAKSKVEVFI